MHKLKSVANVIIGFKMFASSVCTLKNISILLFMKSLFRNLSACKVYLTRLPRHVALCLYRARRLPSIGHYVRRARIVRIVRGNRAEISVSTKNNRLFRTNTRFPLLHESEWVTFEDTTGRVRHPAGLVCSRLLNKLCQLLSRVDNRHR